jgi:hypothetical protein
VPDNPKGGRIVALACLAVLSTTAAAYGPDGHLIAGRVASPMLCRQAASVVMDLTGGEDLGEIGLWADRIRSDPAYADAAPWHYINVADGARLADIEHPPEGDVLLAIERFSDRVGDPALSRNERAEALRFLVHFVVDLHQPLHVGLAEDRGGNAIDLVFRGERTNLHRLWDTHVIEWTGLSVGDYVRSMARELQAAGSVSLDPVVWADESLALRSRVYAYGRAGQAPSADYLDFAASVTRERLALAARRLAGTLNSLLC